VEGVGPGVSRKRDWGHHAGTSPWVPEAIGASSQPVQRIDWMSQSRVCRVVRRRRIRVVRVVGGMVVVVREGLGRCAMRRWARAVGEKEGRTLKCRRARCVVVEMREICWGKGGGLLDCG
jgi:hypothetical protein